jgi:hypothetical protein
MKWLLAIAAAAAMCVIMVVRVHAETYGWIVSNSITDPHSNGGLPNGSTDNLYLWMYCFDGMAAAEMTLESIPPGQVIAFNVMNGFLNAGNVTNLLLAVGGCPGGPLIAGTILILHFAPVAICLTGANVTWTALRIRRLGRMIAKATRTWVFRFA